VPLAANPASTNDAEALKSVAIKCAPVSDFTPLQTTVLPSNVRSSVCSDRIEVGTYLIAAAITGGSITVKNANPQTMRSVLGKLIEIGADIKTEKESISLNMKGKRPKAVSIKTGTYPNFPTDMQAQFTALNTIAKGHSSRAD
jgi:UDP-N-acetylglucosamine 1-carboxyvinyltransferase